MENAIPAQIPNHLRPYVVDQQYDKYSWRDHAVWRYVMHRNIGYLAEVAHESYLDGLKKTGISIELIPSLSDMNAILKKIGWAAVCVSGFIPPEVFMEFQAHRILVIAADIRHFKHIEYTSAPDILHEAAGHAPILANPTYSKYLQEFGRIGAKAFSSAKDHQLYEAIRKLSDLKALPNASGKQLSILENQIAALEADIGNPSEMSLLRNLHWWTVEYGLIGNLDSPKIYGAGLLSSIGESFASMKPELKKIPYSIEAMHFGFDITRMQPHLFVTPDFEYLNTVLKQFSEQMALKKGGAQGVLKAIESNHMATCELSSGIQISGVFSEAILDGEDLVYIKTAGPTELGYQNELLNGHGKEYHSNGFGTPIGKLENCDKPMHLLESMDLDRLSIHKGKATKLNFVSGLKVEGILTNILRKEGRILLMSFDQCTVRYQNKMLFVPEWGVFDMAVGEQLTSACNGDFCITSSQEDVVEIHSNSFVRAENPISEALNALYKKVRVWREEKQKLPDLTDVIKEINKIDKNDWLLPYELLELAHENKDTPNLKIVSEYLSGMPDTKQHLFTLH